MKSHFNNLWGRRGPLEEVPCPLCGSRRSRPAHRENGFTIVRCADCRFVYVNPRPRAQDLRSFYRQYYPSDPAAEAAWAEQMGEIFRDARDQVLTFAPHGRLLDVGCGLGHFVALFRGTPWTASGIELSEETARRAREHSGADVRAGGLEEQDFEDDSFDCVTLFYLLEHLPNPRTTLREVRRVLRPGGMVLIRTPDMEPLIRLRSVCGVPHTFFCPPMHLCDIPPQTLHRLLGDLGFRDIRTSIGGATAPPRRLDRLLSRISGAAAGMIEALTAGRLLLPGVSKTTTAYKPLTSEASAC